MPGSTSNSRPTSAWWNDVTLASPILRALFKGFRLLDVPAMLAQLRFAAIRRRYYEALWQATAAQIGATCERWGFGYHRLTRGTVSTVVRLADVRLDDHLTLDIMGNK